MAVMAEAIPGGAGCCLLRHEATGAFAELSDPRLSLWAWRHHEVLPMLEEAMALGSRQGWDVVWLLGYEAAPACDAALRIRRDAALPLAWFGVYGQRRWYAEPPRPTVGCLIEDIRRELDPGAYGVRLGQVRRALRAGDTYQVNYTFRLEARWAGSPYGLFHRLWQAHHARLAAYVDLGHLVLVSASPELFFRVSPDGLVTCQPMKGTARRQAAAAADRLACARLRLSPKECAEHAMIVDMVRNDLGRIATVGTVKVVDPFRIETYPQVFQMTSTITAAAQADLPRLLGALFPCASITGPPKVATMDLIARLEPSARGWYTGALGWTMPDGSIQSSILIRSAVLERVGHTLRYGTGGGVVWDSTVEAEYDECTAKSWLWRHPVQQQVGCELIETMRWTPQAGFFLLEQHLQRLERSTRELGWSCALGHVVALLESEASAWREPLRVRLLLAADGACRIETRPLLPSSAPVRLGWAAEAVDADDPWLRHKTTASRRAVPSAGEDADEWLFVNQRGEITESSLSNVVVRCGGRWLTPDWRCGLLPGTFRAHLLERGLIQEAVIPREMLEGCEACFLINAVRLWRRALLPVARLSQEGKDQVQRC